jgi:chaperonin GroEL (HSP60 family)
LLAFSRHLLCLGSVARLTHFPLQFATEAAITIVRIDDMIKLDKEESGQEE